MSTDGYIRWLRRRHPIAALHSDLRRWWHNRTNR